MNVFVIGGGPAGMMAAISTAQNSDTKVTILERNQTLGRKLFITGKGRCNLTNLSSYDDYFDNIIVSPNFLRSALYRMDAYQLVKFFNDNGLSTKTERGNRVFPNSDKSSDVIKTLTKCLEKLGVEVLYNQKVIDFEIINNKIFSIKTEKAIFIPDKVILATGGKSYSATGSDGIGYHLAKRARHTIIPTKPALVPILTDYCNDANGKRTPLSNLPSLEGLSLKNVEAKIINKANKCLFREFGEMLFTSNGLSGPIILTLSSKINNMDLSDLSISIDLKPAIDQKTLDNRLVRELTTARNKFLKNSLSNLLPSKLIGFIINLSLIDMDTPVNVISRTERQQLCKLLKNLTFSIKSLDNIDNAIVTSGGVHTKEIDSTTMQSKITRNLYFAGEIIDIDALTGGYNLQLAFSTGYIAGINAVNEEK